LREPIGGNKALRTNSTTSNAETIEIKNVNICFPQKGAAGIFANWDWLYSFTCFAVQGVGLVAG
jgi:hypothetical protein